MARWGIAGAGTIAAKFARNLAQAGSTGVAIAARDLGRAEAFAAEHGLPRAYGSYAELANDPEIDVVYVATTHAQHRDVALPLLAAGMPLLVEKAFALNAPQARQIADAAQAAGVFCMEAMWLRCHPLVLAVRDAVAAGRIGELIGVRADLSAAFPYDPAHRLYDLAVGGGALLDLGVYPIHFAHWLLGTPDRQDVTGRLAPTGSDLTVALQWSYADGRFAQLACSAAARNPFAAIVTGTGGYIEVHGRVHHPSAVVIAADGAPPETLVPGPLDDTFVHEIREVERCLAAGETQSPLVPLAASVDVLSCIDAARHALGVRYPGEA